MKAYRDFYERESEPSWSTYIHCIRPRYSFHFKVLAKVTKGIRYKLAF